MDRVILPYMSGIAIYANNTMLTIGMNVWGDMGLAYHMDCHIC